MTVKLLVGVGFVSLVVAAAAQWPMWPCAIAMSCATGLAPDVQAPLPFLLSETVRAHVRDEQFQVVTSIRGLPLGVRDALQGLFGSQTLAIAEPGAPFQATDHVVDPTLPIRRLIAAGCSMDHCVVYYERGGLAGSRHAALFHWTPDGTRFEWGGIAPPGLTSVDGIRAALLSGGVKGPTQFW